ncbi:MAG: endonuclease/exonuclease/phosphatase family protein [Rubrivivax sp.]
MKTHFFKPTAAAVLALLAATAAQAQLIGDLQGSRHLSTFNNVSVTNIAGIVTAVDGNGFWFQDSGDGNAVTSDAIYVFRGGSGTKPAVGDAVRVNGRVQEFRPGNTATNLTTTQINATASFSGSWTRTSGGNALPAAVVLGTGGLFAPGAIAGHVGNVESAGYSLQPTLYSMDFYESLEGMRVTVPQATSVAARNSFGEIALMPTSQLNAPGFVNSPRGAAVLNGVHFNGQKLYIDDRIAATPVVNSGARLDNVVGVMDFSFGNPKLYVTQAPTVVSNNLQKEVAAPLVQGQLGIGSYNVENLGGNATQARIDAVAGQIAVNMAAPHIVSLQEIQDNNGATNDGTVAADVTLSRLAAAVNAQAPGRNYTWLNVNPQNLADGGQPGGNIRQAFLYDSNRVSFSGVIGGAMDAISPIAAPGGGVAFNLGAGRVDPGNAAFNNSRKPLVTEFTVDGVQLIVIANHFNSKGGDEPLYQPDQPPDRPSEVQRLAQANALGSFVASVLAINPNANIVLTGDLNDFQFADTLAPLTAAGLTNLMSLLPAGERYTYNFDGNAQALDHMFVSPNLLNKAGWAFDVIHANSEFIDQVSDHDPLLLRLAMVPAPVPEPKAIALMLAGLFAVGFIARRRRG